MNKNDLFLRNGYMRKYQSVVEALKEHSTVHPNRIAVFAENQKISYAALYELVCGFANYLLSIGLQRGDQVVMQVRPSLQSVVAHYGTHLAGGIFTPLDDRLSINKLEGFVNKTQAFILISEQKSHCTLWLSRQQVMIVAEKYKNDVTVHVYPNPEEPAEILFSSGTTGEAKGVLCSHKNVVATSENLIMGMEYHSNTLLVVLSPLNHASAIRKLSATVYNGSGIVLLDGMTDIPGYFKVLDEMPVTGLCFLPSAVNILLKLTGNKIADYADKIEFIEVGSAPVPEAEKSRLMELLPSSRHYNLYGYSESGISCTYDYNRIRGLKNCMGRDTVNSRAIVVDDEHKEIESSKNNSGYLAVTGDAVMMGYWNDPELTAQSLANGIFYSTDLGYIEDGFIYLIGRTDDMINIGGFKVSPIEIEEAAMRLEEIEDCACVAADDPVMGQVPKLFIVLYADAVPDTADILEKLRCELEPYKMPKKIVLIDEIPRSQLGKKLRRLLT
jgi:long-chain acyl-CoA synthetase